MTFDEMAEHLTTLGTRRTDKMIWKTALLYYSSISMSRFNFRKAIGTKPYVRFFGIVFAPSGVGKDFASANVEKLFKLDTYADTMMSRYETLLATVDTLDRKISAEVKRYMPKSITVSLEGSKEGLFYVAQAQNASGYGSLNLQSSEFSDIITSSGDILLKTKELYDGKYKSKIIKGDENTETKSDISGLIVNLMAVGTRTGISKNDEEAMNRLVGSGMYRRSIIVESHQRVEKNRDVSRFHILKEYFDALIEERIAEYIAKAEESGSILNAEYIVPIEEGVIELIDEIDDELIDRANEDELDSFKQYDTGSLEVIIDIAHIIMFLEYETTLKRNHVEQARAFFMDTRKTVIDTFKITHPYKSMYDLLKKKAKMTITEMAEIDSNIKMNKGQVEDNVKYLEELCYRNDEVLVQSSGKVIRYSIEPLPKTKLDKLIVSFGTDGRAEKSVHFVPYEISWDLLKQLVVSSKTTEFTLAHYENEHRKAKNFIEGQNLIAFDVDYGMTLQDAQELLSEFKYLIYTTRSNQKEKNGIVCDRFRIIMPTSTTYYVTEEQHKKLYENISEALGITNDSATQNVSRLWFTNPSGSVIDHEGELIDITPYMPDTNKSDEYMPKVREINEDFDMGRLTKREAGMIKWVIANTGTGNRNVNLYKAKKFFDDLGIDSEEKVRYINSMLSDPLPERELQLILRRGG